MNDFTTEILKTLANKGDLNELFRVHLTVIHLFRKGITMSEIADLIEKMYGHHYTPQTMSNMTKVLTEEVNAFKVRTLNDKYVAIFMDATYIPLKRQTVSKEAIYIAIGIREDGTKEVLSYAIA
ncbi:transposase, partial [Enterococcus faecium]|uniref:transposase n=1 Tax=Enterococcus faecium TaxID=1352 RepID=UPI0015C4F227